MRATLAAQPRLLIRRARSPLPPPAGDWLQGPYVYALYAAYGFNQGDIGKLFIAGFGSSMVFGTVVGSLADKQCAPEQPPVTALSLCARLARSLRARAVAVRVQAWQARARAGARMHVDLAPHKLQRPFLS